MNKEQIEKEIIKTLKENKITYNDIKIKDFSTSIDKFFNIKIYSNLFILTEINEFILSLNYNHQEIFIEREKDQIVISFTITN